jgi:hypothetical protein
MSTKKLTTTIKTILVFENGELTKQITYKTKTDAKRQYSHFLKNGIIDPSTGEKVKKATFELL